MSECPVCGSDYLFAVKIDEGELHHGGGAGVAHAEDTTSNWWYIHEEEP